MPSEFVEIHAAGTLLFITGLALAVELFILLVVPRIVAKLNPEKVGRRPSRVGDDELPCRSLPCKS